MKSTSPISGVGLPLRQDTEDFNLARGQAVRVLDHVSQLLLNRLVQVRGLGGQRTHSKLLGNIERLVKQGKRLVGVAGEYAWGGFDPSV